LTLAEVHEAGVVEKILGINTMLMAYSLAPSRLNRDVNAKLKEKLEL